MKRAKPHPGYVVMLPVVWRTPTEWIVAAFNGRLQWRAIIGPTTKEKAAMKMRQLRRLARKGK